MCDGKVMCNVYYWSDSSRSLESSGLLSCLERHRVFNPLLKSVCVYMCMRETDREIKETKKGRQRQTTETERELKVISGKSCSSYEWSELYYVKNMKKCKHVYEMTNVICLVLITIEKEMNFILGLKQMNFDQYYISR